MFVASLLCKVGGAGTGISCGKRSIGKAHFDDIVVLRGLCR